MVEDVLQELVASINRAYVWIYPGNEHTKLY
jgi:hypothetical protein